MIFGVDYADGTPNPAAFKKAGVQFVCRYLAPAGSAYDWKRLTKTECLLLRTSGFKLVTVFEAGANRALAGRNAGVVDARSAQASLTVLAAPVDAPVYFAVDFDATPAQQPAINAYLAGVVSVLGHNRVGIYGGYWPVSRALSAGVCKYAWQTEAWSVGKWDGRAQLRQNGSDHIGGVSVDKDYALTATDYGQWYGTPRPPKPPTPTPFVFPKDDTFWTWLRWRTGTGEFAPYGRRNVQVRPNVPQHIPAAWWRAMSFYLKNQPAT